MPIIGTWNIVMNSPFGEQKFDLTFTDDPPRARMAAHGVEPVELDNVTLDGQSGARFTQDVVTPMKMHVLWSVEAEGDELFGTAKAGVFPAQKVKGTRA